MGIIARRKNSAANNVDLDSINTNRGTPMWQPKKADYETIREYASYQCSIPEIAAAVGISAKTLEHIIVRARNFDQNKKPTMAEKIACRVLHEIEDGREFGKCSLRSSQFRMATANVQMSIHLGKQYLGHSDKQELTGKDGQPLNQPPEVTVNFVGVENEEGKK